MKRKITTWGKDVDGRPVLVERYEDEGPDTATTWRGTSYMRVAGKGRRGIGIKDAASGQETISAIPTELSPHSLRRTFASLLYLRGENPVYVMHQMGHTDPKLALRIYTRVMGEQRRRGPGARLVGVLDGAQWTEPGTDKANPPAQSSRLEIPVA